MISLKLSHFFKAAQVMALNHRLRFQQIQFPQKVLMNLAWSTGTNQTWKYTMLSLADHQSPNIFWLGSGRRMATFQLRQTCLLMMMFTSWKTSMQKSLLWPWNTQKEMYEGIAILGLIWRQSRIYNSGLISTILTP